MPSTMYGIYNAQRALSINQAAIEIVSNNVSNMNTKGYSKQRVEISQLSNLSPYQNPMDASENGMGATIDSITRNRDAFLDNSLRRETTDLSYYKEYSTNSVDMENIVDELGDTGLSASLNEFYNALNQLSSNPNDFVTRSSLVQNAISLTTTFNNIYTELQEARTSLVGDINNPDTLNQSKLSMNIDDFNNKLSSIADLNQKINLSTSQGLTPNSLLDERDSLLDEISEYMSLSVKTEINNTVTVSVGNVELVKGGERKGFFAVEAGDVDNPSVLKIKNDGGGTLLNNAYSIMTSGKIGAILQAGGSDTNKVTTKGMIDSMNTLANQFATALNNFQTGGRYIDNSANPHELSNNTGNPIDAMEPLDANPVVFFEDSDGSGIITAGNIQVNDIIVNNPYQIAAASLTSGLDETGNGSNALLMSRVRDLKDPLLIDLGGASTQEFITNFIGKLGTRSKSLQDNYDIKSSIVDQITAKRDSVTGVSLDEELTDLVRFQKSYEASAKIMSVLQQTLSTIINMMG